MAHYTKPYKWSPGWWQFWRNGKRRRSLMDFNLLSSLMEWNYHSTFWSKSSLLLNLSEQSSQNIEQSKRLASTVLMSTDSRECLQQVFQICVCAVVKCLRLYAHTAKLGVRGGRQVSKLPDQIQALNQSLGATVTTDLACHQPLPKINHHVKSHSMRLRNSEIWLHF